MERIGRPTPIRLIAEFIKSSPVNWIKLFIGPGITFMPDEDFLVELVAGKSLYRWGDGETAIARGKDISYQKFDPLLSEKLLELSKCDSPGLIHGVSWAYNSKIWDRSWNLRLFKILFSTRIWWLVNHKTLPMNQYVETTVWYKYYEQLPEVIEAIAENNPIALISSSPEYMKYLPKNSRLILAKAKDAFDEYQALHDEVDNWISENRAGAKPVLLLAVGPTSKAFVLDFHKRVRVIDVGHGFSFHHRGFGKYAWK
jgi:hypothetical protein